MWFPAHLILFLFHINNVYKFSKSSPVSRLLPKNPDKGDAEKHFLRLSMHLHSQYPLTK